MFLRMEKVMSKVIVYTILVGFISGCGQSALDKCTDSKSYLWSSKASGNTYKGNEQYWDAVTACEDKHR